VVFKYFDNGKATMNEDVFPIEAGDFPVSHVDFPGWWFQWFLNFHPDPWGNDPI